MEPMFAGIPAPEAVISDRLSWTEICTLFPDQWVCVVEIDRDTERPHLIRGARVVGHGKTRREPFEQAAPFWSRFQQIGHYFTGPIRAPRPRFL